MAVAICFIISGERMNILFIIKLKDFVRIKGHRGSLVRLSIKSRMVSIF